MDPRTARERRRGRELAAQMLSAWDANPSSPLTTVAGVGELTRASETHLEFAKVLANAVWKHLEEIDRCLDEATKPYWKENMGRVERSVLRVGVAELLTASAPPRVVLSEAIEVARRYAGEDSTSFVHAVLDSVIKRLGIIDVQDSQPKGANPRSEGANPQPKGVDPRSKGVDPQPEAVDPPPEGVDPPPEGVDPPPQGEDSPPEGDDAPPDSEDPRDGPDA